MVCGENPALRRKFFTWLTVNEYNVPTFVQTVATEAAYTKAAGWLDEALRYIEDNIRYTEQFLAERIPQIRAMRPQASFLVWLDCSALGLKGKDLVDLLSTRRTWPSTTARCLAPEANATCGSTWAAAAQRLKRRSANWRTPSIKT